MAVTPARGYPLQVTGTNVNTWGNLVNTQVFSVIDQNFGGSTTISLAGLTGNVTVTTSQDENAELVLTGALAGAVVLQLPGGRSGHHFVQNNATGFGVTIATTAGGSIGAPCATNAMTFVFNDGTNVTNPNASGFLPHPGATTTTSATTFTLSTGGTTAQRVIMTAPAQSVTLPNATTYTSLGGPMFSVVNGGGYEFGVRRNDNSLLCVLEPGQAVDLYLDDQSTPAGIWHFVGETGVALNTLTFTFPSLYNYLYPAVVGLGNIYQNPVQVGSSSSWIMFLASNSGGTAGSLYAVAIDNSTFPATVGTPVLVDTSVYGAFPSSVNQIDNANIWCNWSNSGVTNYKAAVITLTGPSTLSVGGIATTTTSTPLAAGAFLTGGIVKLSNTLFLCFAGNTTQTVMAVQISGTSISVGSPYTQSTSGTIVISGYPMSATSAIVFAAGTSGVTVNTYTISGTTITPVSALSAANYVTDQTVSTCQLSPTSYVFGYGAQSTSFPTYQAVTISGATATLGAPLVPQNITVVVGTFAGAFGGPPNNVTTTGFNGLVAIDSTHALGQFRQTTNNNAVWVLTNTAGTLTAGTGAYGGVGAGNGAATTILNNSWMGWTDRFNVANTNGGSIQQFTMSTAGLTIVGASAAANVAMTNPTFAQTLGGVVGALNGNNTSLLGNRAYFWKYGANGPTYLGSLTPPNYYNGGLYPVGTNQIACAYVSALGPQNSLSSFPTNCSVSMWEFPS